MQSTSTDQESLELRIKRLNRSCDLSVEILKRFQQRPSIWKRYVEGILNVDVLIRVRGSASAKDNFGRVIIKTAADTRFGGAVDVGQSTDCGKCPVLVWVGEITQGFRPCASHVRLELLNGVDVDIAKSRQVRFTPALKASLFTFGVNAIILNRELR